MPALQALGESEGDVTVDDALRIVELVAAFKPDTEPVQKYEVYKLVLEASVALADEVRRLRELYGEVGLDYACEAEIRDALQTELDNLRAAAERGCKWLEVLAHEEGTRDDYASTTRKSADTLRAAIEASK